MSRSKISRICSSEIWRKTESKKVMYCFKTGMAVSMVSLFYYMNPLYQGVGENVMWAILTVFVVFEYTVGATIGRCLNRVLGGVLGGALGLGVHSMASQLGNKFQPILLQGSVFLLVSGVTFLRLIPSIRAHFDHGALIFMITFTLVTISGYRIDELMDLVNDKVTTTALGCFICILISILVYPTWAGSEIHNTVIRKMKNLHDSLDACIEGCFSNRMNVNESDFDYGSKKKRLSYQDFLNSRGMEESLTNFARWEPTHGNFHFGYPWQGYLKIRDSIQSCAILIEQLNRIIDAQSTETSPMKDHLIKICNRLCSASSAVMKELIQVMNTMTKSSNIVLIIEETTNSANEMRSALRLLSQQTIQVTIIEHGEVIEVDEKRENTSNIAILPAVEILPMVQVCFLLIEIAEGILKIAEAVNKLGDKAKFPLEQIEKPKEHRILEVVPHNEGEKNRVTIADVLQSV